MITEICDKILNETSKYNITLHQLSKQYQEQIMEETKLFPPHISLSKRIRAISENNDCICKQCGIIHGDVAKAGYCGNKCYTEARKEAEISAVDFPVYNAIRVGERKFADKIEGIDYMVCDICTAKTGELGTHIRMHDISMDDYKTTYNLITLKNQKQIDKVTGAKNPAYNHGGKFSPFSEKFIYAESTDRLALFSRAAKTRSDNDNETTRLSYWLKQTAGDVESAELLLAKRQATFSLHICIEKYGEEKGSEIWNSRQEKWLTSYNDKSNEEMMAINKKKSNQMSFNILWKNETIVDGIFYLLDLSNGFYKIGITSRTVAKRYANASYSIIMEVKLKLGHCFIIEQILKKQLMDYGIPYIDQVGGFGWTETFKDINVSEITTLISTLAGDEQGATRIFKEKYNLKYAENF